MHMARNDQLFLPESFCSLDCFSQSAHLSFSLAHLALAAFHCLVVHLETSSAAVDVAEGEEGAGVDGAGVCASATPAKARMATAREAERRTDMGISWIGVSDKADRPGHWRRNMML